MFSTYLEANISSRVSPQVLATETREWLTQPKEVEEMRPQSTNGFGYRPPSSGVLSVGKRRTYTRQLVPEALQPEPTVMRFGRGEPTEEVEHGSTPRGIPLGGLRQDVRSADPLRVLLHVGTQGRWCNKFCILALMSKAKCRKSRERTCTGLRMAHDGW